MPTDLLPQSSDAPTTDMPDALTLVQFLESYITDSTLR